MLMRQYGAEVSGDVVRQFFRTHVSSEVCLEQNNSLWTRLSRYSECGLTVQVEHIDQLLSIVFNNYSEAVSQPMPTAKRTSWVYEADRILVVSSGILLSLGL